MLLFVVYVCKFLPPYVIYKAESIYDKWTENGPEQAEYTYTASGWMESLQFLNWFKLFIKWTDNDEEKILHT